MRQRIGCLTRVRCRYPTNQDPLLPEPLVPEPLAPEPVLLPLEPDIEPPWEPLPEEPVLPDMEPV
jgi:hypothetical protein